MKEDLQVGCCCKKIGENIVVAVVLVGVFDAEEEKEREKRKKEKKSDRRRQHEPAASMKVSKGLIRGRGNVK